MTDAIQLEFPAARHGDPLTSHVAGVNAQVRAGSQKAALLAEYAQHPLLGLTDEQAGLETGLAGKPGCCYWKRCSELRQAGLIRVTSEKRESRAGEMQQVCVITGEGLKLIDEFRLQNAE